jgi:hypothetical protein
VTARLRPPGSRAHARALHRAWSSRPWPVTVGRSGSSLGAVTDSTTGAAPALFVPDGDRLVPTDRSRGPWSPTALHGGPVAALVARAAESVEGGEDRQLVRITLELLRPVPLTPLRVTSAVVRPGHKVQLIDTVVEADGVEVAWSRALRIRMARDESPISPTVPEDDAPRSPPRVWPGRGSSASIAPSTVRGWPCVRERCLRAPRTGHGVDPAAGAGGAGRAALPVAAGGRSRRLRQRGGRRAPLRPRTCSSTPTSPCRSTARRWGSGCASMPAPGSGPRASAPPSPPCGTGRAASAGPSRTWWWRWPVTSDTQNVTRVPPSPAWPSCWWPGPRTTIPVSASRTSRGAGARWWRPAPTAPPAHPSRWPRHRGRPRRHRSGRRGPGRSTSGSCSATSPSTCSGWGRRPWPVPWWWASTPPAGGGPGRRHPPHRLPGAGHRRRRCRAARRPRPRRGPDRVLRVDSRVRRPAGGPPGGRPPGHRGGLGARRRGPLPAAVHLGDHRGAQGGAVHPGPPGLHRPAPAEAYGFERDDVAYCTMPLFHGNALMALWAPSLVVGATVALARRFSASGFGADVRRYGPPPSPTWARRWPTCWPPRPPPTTPPPPCAGASAPRPRGRPRRLRAALRVRAHRGVRLERGRGGHHPLAGHAHRAPSAGPYEDVVVVDPATWRSAPRPSSTPPAA